MRPYILASLLCVLALAILAASCGGNSSSKQPPGPQTIFFDDFSGAFPGTNWTVGAGSPAIDPDHGSPPPALMFPSLYATGYSWIQSNVTPFSTSLGITISADMGFPTGQPVFSQFWVYDKFPALGGGPQAYVYLDQTAGTVTYYLATDVNPSVTVVNSLAADTKFHTYTFKVDASGNATWSQDGVQQASTTGFSCDTLILKFEGGWTGETYLDNVNVTVPLNQGTSRGAARGVEPKSEQQANRTASAGLRPPENPISYLVKPHFRVQNAANPLRGLSLAACTYTSVFQTLFYSPSVCLIGIWYIPHLFAEMQSD